MPSPWWTSQSTTSDAPHQPFGAQPRDGHRDVVEQAVAAGEVAARVVGAAAEVHPDPVLQRPPRRGQRPADRPPPALDQHLRPRQPEAALLAQRHLTVTDPTSSSASWTAASHSHGTGSDSSTVDAPLRRARAAACTWRSGTCARAAAGSPSGRGSRPPRVSACAPLNGQLPAMAIYGGIDLGGTKIQAAVVDEDADHAGPRRQARPDAAEGRPEGDRRADGRRARGLARGGRAERVRPRRRRRRLARQRRRHEGHRLRRDEPVRVDRLASTCARRSRRTSAARP